MVGNSFIPTITTMADDSTLLENTEVGSSITDSLIRLLWRCGTFCSGIVVLAAGVLYVKVSAIIYVCLILCVPLFTYYFCISCDQYHAFDICYYITFAHLPLTCWCLQTNVHCSKNRCYTFLVLEVCPDILLRIQDDIDHHQNITFHSKLI